MGARHLSELLDVLEAKGVALRILNFGGDAVDTRNATGRLMLNTFAAMAQFEREIMLERQREGIAKVKAEGKYKGRKPTARAKAEGAVRVFRQGKRVAHIAKELGDRARECIPGARSSGQHASLAGGTAIARREHDSTRLVKGRLSFPFGCGRQVTAFSSKTV